MLCAPPIESAGQPVHTSVTPYRPPNDLAGLCVYQADNRRLSTGPSPDIIFVGDSITQAWVTIDPAFFASNRVGRGISGQTSAQMLLRFRQDAIALRPKVIHLLAGTNDVAGNAGAMGSQAYQSNVIAMADLAQANGIILVLGAIPPARQFPWRTAIEPVEPIRALNQWLRDFANQRGLIFIDYYAALAAPSGAALDGLTRDGVHPNASGYRVMAEIAEPALAMALDRARTTSPTP